MVKGGGNFIGSSFDKKLHLKGGIKKMDESVDLMQLLSKLVKEDTIDLEELVSLMFDEQEQEQIYAYIKGF